MDAPATSTSGFIAVGDIHGCIDALDQILHACRAYQNHTFVFLGDYIDGGPESDAVISRVRSIDAVCLMGNHEISYLRTCRKERGKTVPDHAQGVPAISNANYDWLCSSLRWYHTTSDYIFVHAGLNPDLDFENQDELSLLWSRYQGRYDEYAPRFVIHGHTAVTEVERVGQRVNINTDAGYGGPLTALVLPEWKTIQSDPTPARSISSDLDRIRQEMEELRREYPTS